MKMLRIIQEVITERIIIYTSEATLEVLAKEIAELTTEDLKDKFSGSPTEKTDANGEAEFETLDYGLYLILQTDVSGAEYEDEPIILSHRQTPMLVSVPGKNEEKEVKVNVKTPLGYGELTKSIVGVGDINGNWENVEDSATEVTGRATISVSGWLFSRQGFPAATRWTTL